MTACYVLVSRPQLKLDGVVLAVQLQNQTQEINLGEVTLSVDDLLRAIPPGTRSYDKGMLEPNGTTSTVMFNTTA